MTTCETIATQVGAMFQCSPTRRGDVRVRTPFYYPDGGIVDVFVVNRGGQQIVTDFGEALGWLGLQSVSGIRSPKQEKLVRDVCLTHGVELYKGQLLSRVNTQSVLADAMIRVSQAAVRVADLWFTMRTRAVESLTDVVADFLMEKRVEHEREVRVPGRSGRSWNINFHTVTTARSNYVIVLSSGSRAAAKRVTEHACTAWHDLTHLRVPTTGLGFVSLFDDTSDVWDEADFRLAEDFSTIARWSAPDEFEQILRAG